MEAFDPEGVLFSFLGDDILILETQKLAFPNKSSYTGIQWSRVLGGMAIQVTWLRAEVPQP